MSTDVVSAKVERSVPVERRRSLIRRIIGRVGFWQLLLLLAILGTWELASGWLIDELFVSKPTAIVELLVQELTTTEFLDHIRYTYTEVFIGYALGIVFGVGLGSLLSRSRFLGAVVEPFIMGLYSIPKITLAPLFIVWLGIGMASKVAVTFISAFFLIFYNTFAGMRSLNEELISLAKVMGASRRDILWRMIIPGALPMIMLGMRAALPFAVIGAIVGEFMASDQGLGFYILYAGSTLNSTGLFVGVIVLVVGVAILTALLRVIERRVVRWKPQNEVHTAGSL